MNLLRWLAIVLFTVSSPALPGQELSDAQWELESLSEEGGFSFQPDTGIATAVNGLRVRYLHPEFGEAVLQADRVTLDQLSGQITAEGGVTLQRDGQVWRGDQLDYNFNTQVMGASNYRTGKTPFFAAGTVIEGANHPRPTVPRRRLSPRMMPNHPIIEFGPSKSKSCPDSTLVPAMRRSTSARFPSCISHTFERISIARETIGP